MELRLYNTLSRQKETFAPLDPSNVRMYVCGPTVYDYAHIGNARPIIVFDVLFRLLRHLYGADHVTYVRNITDVDDKINARAAEEGVSIGEVTARTTAQFHADIDALGALRPSVEPRATEHIGEMVDIIRRLIDGGFAYEAEGHVLFSPSGMNAANGVLPRYGALSNRSLDEMLAGARVDVAPYKRDAMDFVLWKPSTPDLPGWDSPWGRGRPGWHIECSAMSWKHLGERFDIHGGGIDLVFPHHENEIAQSCCAFQSDRMANIWMHNGFLQVEGEKMSKSLGNFFTINELLTTERLGDRKWPGQVLRIAMLMTHYREPIDFGARRLDEALSLYDRLARAARYADRASDKADPSLVEMLLNDLNTYGAILRLRELSSLVMGTKRGVESGYEEEIQYAKSVFLTSADLLGLGFDSDSELSDDTASVVNELIAARAEARKAKNWAEADRIRDELDKMGVALKDAKDPATGELVTTWEVKR